MLIALHTLDETITDQEGTPYDLGRFHELPDFAGHSFIILKRPRYFGVTICRGREVAQKAKVHNLNATIGELRSGGSRLQAFELVLDPTKPIWPIADLVDLLIAGGIQNWRISPMFTDSLVSCVPSHMDMVSDGDIGREAVPAHKGEGDRIEFQVANATWAIMFSGHTIEHVYMGVNADGESLLDAIERIKRAL